MAKHGLHRVDADVLDLYQQRVAQLVPRLRPPHVPAFCAALPAHCRGVLGGAAPAAAPSPQANGTTARPHSTKNPLDEVPGGLRQRPARTARAAAPAAALDKAGLEAIHRQQNLQARTRHVIEPQRLMCGAWNYNKRGHPGPLQLRTVAISDLCRCQEAFAVDGAAHAHAQLLHTLGNSGAHDHEVALIASRGLALFFSTSHTRACRTR